MKTNISEYKSPDCRPLEVGNEGVLCLSNVNIENSSNEGFNDLKDFEW